MSVPTSSKLTPIIPFNLIVDTDFGLIRMIDKMYHNTDTFYSSLLSMPDKNLIYLLYHRKNENPLYIVSKDKEDLETMNSYYDQFIESEYVKILKYSCTTSIHNLIKLSLTTDGVIKPCILCRNNLEKEFLSKIDKDTFSKCAIEISQLEYLNLNGFDPIYVKNYKDAIKSYKTLLGKNIYVAGYRFNMYEDESMKEPMLNPDIYKVLGNANEIKITSIYNIDETYIAKG